MWSSPLSTASATRSRSSASAADLVPLTVSPEQAYRATLGEARRQMAGRHPDDVETLALASPRCAAGSGSKAEDPTDAGLDRLPGLRWKGSDPFLQS